MKKQISVIILALLLALVLTSAAAFAETGVSSFYEDNSGILSANQWKPIENKLEEVSDKYECGVYIYITDTFGGQSPEEFADDFYDYSGLGYGPDCSGIILAVNYDSGEWAISTTGCGITAFTDAGQEYIMNQVAPLLREEPAEAFTAYADLCDQFLAQAETGEPYDSGTLPAEPRDINPVTDIIIGIVIGVLTALVIMLVQKSALKTVRREAAARNYLRPGSLNLTASHDRFLYSHIDRTRLETSSSGGSSTHTGPSGTTHGGSSGRF